MLGTRTTSSGTTITNPSLVIAPPTTLGGTVTIANLGGYATSTSMFGTAYVDSFPQTGDDATTIQTALNTGAPVVVLAPRTYALSKGLVLSTPGQTLAGTGRGLTTLTTPANSAFSVVTMAANGTTLANVVVNMGANCTGTSIVANNVSGLAVTGVRVNGAYNGVATGNCSNITISHSTMSGITGQYGFWFENGSGLRKSDTMMQNATSNNSSGATGVVFRGFSNVVFEQAIYLDCWMGIWIQRPDRSPANVANALNPTAPFDPTRDCQNFAFKFTAVDTNKYHVMWCEAVRNLRIENSYSLGGTYWYIAPPCRNVVVSTTSIGGCDGGIQVWGSDVTIGTLEIHYGGGKPTTSGITVQPTAQNVTISAITVDHYNRYGVEVLAGAKNVLVEAVATTTCKLGSVGGSAPPSSYVSKAT